MDLDKSSLTPLKRSTREKMATARNIHSVGWQEDVRPWYASADALVFPSHREGFPNVVIEAGAMGLPSIVTDINGSREIIREGENGTIVPSQDEVALYIAMKRLVENRRLVRTWAEQARPLVASRYEQGYVCRCLKHFYRSILK